jgi:hypothetical protein
VVQVVDTLGSKLGHASLDGLKPGYTGIFLNTASSNLLFEKHSCKFDKKLGEHVTLCYGSANFSKWSVAPVGEWVDIDVWAVSSNNRVQGALVKIRDTVDASIWVKTRGGDVQALEHPHWPWLHITMSRDSTARAQETGPMLRDRLEEKKISLPQTPLTTLRGRVGLMAHHQRDRNQSKLIKDSYTFQQFKNRVGVSISVDLEVRPTENQELKDRSLLSFFVGALTFSALDSKMKIGELKGKILRRIQESMPGICETDIHLLTNEVGVDENETIAAVSGKVDFFVLGNSDDYFRDPTSFEFVYLFIYLFVITAGKLEEI